MGSTKYDALHFVLRTSHFVFISIDYSVGLALPVFLLPCNAVIGPFQHISFALFYSIH
jgi:hypothetical protein